MGRATREPLRRVGSRSRAGAVAVGDYMFSDRDLYRVEQLTEERVLIEDCRTGDLIDAPVEELAALRRLERS